MGRPEETVASEGPLAAFASDLRALRRATGEIPYRDLGELARYSASALSTAASGRKLPTLELTLAYVRACGCTEDEVGSWERRWHEVNESLGRPGRAPRRPPPTTVTARFADLVSARSIAQFVGEMHKLMIGSRQLTLKAVERRAREAGLSLPKSTLHDALKGDRLPQWRVVEAFVIACGDEDALDRWHEAWTRLAVAAVRPDPETGLFTVQRRIGPPDQPLGRRPADGGQVAHGRTSARQEVAASSQLSETDRGGEPLKDGDPRQIGPYRLLRHLGSGGMGRVYLGVDEAGARAAVKVLHDGLPRNREFRQRFGREVAAARGVAGPFFARVLDADLESPRSWLASEYVPGPSLHTMVSEGGPLSAPAVRWLGIALATALATVHESGLVHRDVKPANILMADHGPTLIDFGIARDTRAPTITQTGNVVGTPGFMAPEQVLGMREIGPPADIFALAGVLAFAATGRYPFGDGDVMGLMYRVVQEAPDLDGVPAELRYLIVRCLAKDPVRRPSAKEIMGTLAEGIAASEDVPVQAGAGEPQTTAIRPAPEQPALDPPTRRTPTARTMAARTMRFMKPPPWR